MCSGVLLHYVSCGFCVCSALCFELCLRCCRFLLLCVFLLGVNNIDFVASRMSDWCPSFCVAEALFFFSIVMCGYVVMRSPSLLDVARVFSFYVVGT